MHIRKKVASVLAFFVVAGFATSSLNSQNTAASKGSVNAPGDRWPVVDYDPPKPADRSERDRRLKRDKRFNKSPWEVHPSDPSQETTSFDYAGPLPPLPVARSRAVVVGVVTDARAYLSEDRSGVYSEFSVQVAEVLKNDGGLPLPAGAQITATRLGGRVRFRSGHVHLYRVAEHSAPGVGGKYVFFLGGTDEDDNFLLLTAYELSNGKAFPLDSGPHAAKHAGSDESKLLGEISEAVHVFSPPLPN